MAYLEKSQPSVFQVYGKLREKGRFCSDHLVCDVRLIVSVKGFHITIVEFFTGDELNISPKRSKIT